MRPEISVIVPAFNEERYIKHLFRGLKVQTFRDFEVIVVDGNSTDGTREISKRHGATVVIDRKRNIGEARNRGVRSSSGEILLFTNADTLASSGLLMTYHELFKDKAVVAATGPLVPLEDTTRFIEFGYMFASVVLAKAAFAIGKPSISGSNFAVRRSAFKESGGFDETLFTYEDLDLAHRLRKLGAVRYVDDAVVATSSRRIAKWGIPRYILFNAGNVARYNLFHKPKEHYEPIR